MIGTLFYLILTPRENIKNLCKIVLIFFMYSNYCIRYCSHYVSNIRIERVLITLGLKIVRSSCSIIPLISLTNLGLVFDVKKSTEMCTVDYAEINHLKKWFGKIFHVLEDIREKRCP